MAPTSAQDPQFDILSPSTLPSTFTGSNSQDSQSHGQRSVALAAASYFANSSSKALDPSLYMPSGSHIPRDRDHDVAMSGSNPFPRRGQTRLSTPFNEATPAPGQQYPSVRNDRNSVRHQRTLAAMLPRPAADKGPPDRSGSMPPRREVKRPSPATTSQTANRHKAETLDPGQMFVVRMVDQRGQSLPPVIDIHRPSRPGSTAGPQRSPEPLNALYDRDHPNRARLPTDSNTKNLSTLELAFSRQSPSPLLREQLGEQEGLHWPASVPTWHADSVVTETEDEGNQVVSCLSESLSETMAQCHVASAICHRAADHRDHEGVEIGSPIPVLSIPKSNEKLRDAAGYLNDTGIEDDNLLTRTNDLMPILSMEEPTQPDGPGPQDMVLLLERLASASAVARMTATSDAKMFQSAKCAFDRWNVFCHKKAIEQAFEPKTNFASDTVAQAKRQIEDDEQEILLKWQKGKAAIAARFHQMQKMKEASPEDYPSEGSIVAETCPWLMEIDENDLLVEDAQNLPMKVLSLQQQKEVLQNFDEKISHRIRGIRSQGRSVLTDALKRSQQVDAQKRVLQGCIVLRMIFFRREDRARMAGLAKWRQSAIEDSATHRAMTAVAGNQANPSMARHLLSLLSVDRLGREREEYLRGFRHGATTHAIHRASERITNVINRVDYRSSIFCLSRIRLVTAIFASKAPYVPIDVRHPTPIAIGALRNSSPTRSARLVMPHPVPEDADITLLRYQLGQGSTKERKEATSAPRENISQQPSAQCNPTEQRTDLSEQGRTDHEYDKGGPSGRPVINNWADAIHRRPTSDALHSYPESCPREEVISDDSLSPETQPRSAVLNYALNAQGSETLLGEGSTALFGTPDASISMPSRSSGNRDHYPDAAARPYEHHHNSPHWRDHLSATESQPTSPSVSVSLSTERPAPLSSSLGDENAQPGRPAQWGDFYISCPPMVSGPPAVMIPSAPKPSQQLPPRPQRGRVAEAERQVPLQSPPGRRPSLRRLLSRALDGRRSSSEAPRGVEDRVNFPVDGRTREGRD